MLTSVGMAGDEFISVPGSKASSDRERLEPVLEIRLIGPPRVVRADGAEVDVRGQKPWAVLGRILLADRPLSRRELSQELFPEATDPLGALRWCLAAIRKAVGSADVFTGDPVDPTLPTWIELDVARLQGGELPENDGELLEGIDPPCGPEFTTWLLVAREHVASRLAAVRRERIITAISRQDHATSIRLAEVAARRSPYDEGAQVLLVKSLASAGHADAAQRHVLEVEKLYRDHLGCEPSPALRSAARAHVAAEPPGVPAAQVARGLLTSGRAAVGVGAADAGVDCLRRAVSHAESARDDALLAECLFELGSALVHSVRGFDDEGSILLERAEDLARGVGDVTLTVGALRERAYADTLVGRRHDADHRLRRALDAAGGDASLTSGVHAVLGMNAADWGRRADALDHFEFAIDQARSSGEQRWEAFAQGVGAWTALLDGDAGRAEEWSMQCLQTVRELAWLSFEPWPTLVLAETRLMSGAEPPDTGYLEHCFSVSCALGDPCWQGASARLLALHHARLGDRDGALRWIVDARTRATVHSDTWVAMIGEILLTESTLRIAAGDARGGEAAWRDCVGFAARTHLDDVLHRALRLSGRPGDGDD